MTDQHPTLPQGDIKNRALLIAFHFPPQSESSGIQRTLSFAKHLDGFGWTPMVVSAAPMAYERKNSSQLASVPAELVVRRSSVPVLLAKAAQASA